MIRRHSLHVLALVIAFCFGALASSMLPSATAQPVAGQRKCVGVAATRSENLIFVYRAFEDGTVEATVDVVNAGVVQQRAEGAWTKVSK